MLGDSSNSVLATPTTASGGGGGGSEVVIPPVTTSTGAHQHEGSSEAEGDRSFGGNRWPRQETLALLRIRSEMDVAFRDASAKGPLWDEVSRKLKELGYNRSAKKCKEKFENVYKYHKRTKEGRSGKQEGKAYRFFDQLEAFDQTHHPPALPPPKPEPPLALVSNPTVNAMPAVVNPTPVSSSTTVGASVSHPNTTSTTVPSSINLSTTAVPSLPMPHPPTILNPTPPPPPNPTNIPSSNFPSFSPDLFSNSTSSSTSSDIELQGQAKRKRKWKDFFERLMKEVVHKQEEMQKRFLETIERREQERMAREESWRMQEMTRINREREILAQERSIAAAKDAAVMAFLQKLSEQQNPAAPPPPPAVRNNNNNNNHNNHNNNNNPPPAQPPQPVAAQPPTQQQQQPPPPVAQLPMTTTTTLQAQPVHMEIVKADNINGDQSFNMPASSSRWPKVEVQALISLRTELDSKYQDSGPKGPLWEEISAGMRKLGYNRNAKRCKEKWENINKYFKKVKESNKKRPEDSKTCPYFHQLDALYKEKNKSILDASSSSSALFKAENSVPLMVRPEQQWPPPPHDHQLQLDKNNNNSNRPHHDTVMEDVGSEDHQNHHDEDDDKDMEEDEEEEEEDEASGYEIVANNNKPSSMSAS